MNLYVWSETLATGAYHEDGSAVVIAESVEAARALLSLIEDPAEPPRRSYHWAEAARQVEPFAVVRVAEDEVPRVVVREVGCDC